MRTTRALVASPRLPPRSTIVENPILFDRGTITERYANNPNVPGLLPADIARIVRDVLPNGVATIRLSDVASEVNELSTTPLPDGRVLIGLAGPTV